MSSRYANSVMAGKDVVTRLSSLNQWGASNVTHWPITCKLWNLLDIYWAPAVTLTQKLGGQSYIKRLPRYPSQSESLTRWHEPIRAERQEAASRDQYIEPPTASVLGGVYLKSAPVKKWEDTDILIKIKTATGALLFLSTPWPRLSFFLVRSELQSACQSHFHASTQRSFRPEQYIRTWTQTRDECRCRCLNVAI